MSSVYLTILNLYHLVTDNTFLLMVCVSSMGFIIFIAHGWTINVDSIEDFDLFLPIAIMLGIFQIVIIGIGRLIDANENF